MNKFRTLSEGREKVLKLSSDSSKIVSEAKYKTIYGEGRPLDLACVARVHKVSDIKASNRKVFNHKHLEIFLKICFKMLQRLSIALAQ